MKLPYQQLTPEEQAYVRAVPYDRISVLSRAIYDEGVIRLCQDQIENGSWKPLSEHATLSIKAMEKEARRRIKEAGG